MFRLLYSDERADRLDYSSSVRPGQDYHRILFADAKLSQQQQASCSCSCSSRAVEIVYLFTLFSYPYGRVKRFRHPFHVKFWRTSNVHSFMTWRNNSSVGGKDGRLQQYRIGHKKQPELPSRTQGHVGKASERNAGTCTTRAQHRTNSSRKYSIRLDIYININRGVNRSRFTQLIGAI